jgi:hypothetical protein
MELTDWEKEKYPHHIDVGWLTEDGYQRAGKLICEISDFRYCMIHLKGGLDAQGSDEIRFHKSEDAVLFALKWGRE